MTNPNKLNYFIQKRKIIEEFSFYPEQCLIGTNVDEISFYHLGNN